jgi:hypothetical protein
MREIAGRSTRRASSSPKKSPWQERKQFEANTRNGEERGEGETSAQGEIEETEENDGARSRYTTHWIQAAVPPGVLGRVDSVLCTGAVLL